MKPQLFSQIMHAVLFVALAVFAGLGDIQMSYALVGMAFLAGVALPSPVGGNQA